MGYNVDTQGVRGVWVVLPPPPSPYPPLYRGYFGGSKRGVNAVTEIFPEIFGEIGTIFLIPLISLHIRG